MTLRFPLISLMLALTLLPSVVADAAETGHSYRLMPPLKLAARPVDGRAPASSPQSDPFKPRDRKKQPSILAVQGYCLVSLRDQQQWNPGSPQVQAIVGGKVYLFTNPRTRDIFLAAKESYLPALDGDCVVTFAESGERVSGQLGCGLVYGQRAFFFRTPTQLQAFQAEPELYTNADLVDGGACVVSKLTENRHVAGLPQTVATVDGRRYFFASAYHRRIFEQAPGRFLVRPLRNPLAAQGVEVPAFADVFDVSSWDIGKQLSLPVIDGAFPLGSSRTPLAKKKGAKNTDSDSQDELEEFVNNRAMSGYCPVTIRTQNTWTRGKVKFRHTFDGKRYYLAGSEELTVFRSNPRQYAPVLGGDSIVAWTDEYQREAGSVFHAFIYKERLYLFVNEKERETFKANPAKYENADLAEQGCCVVSRTLDKQETSGSEEFEALYFGRRYRFASETYLQKFLADPKAFIQ